MTCNFIRATIRAIREAFPFSTPSQRSIALDVPELYDVNEAVKAYQRPKDFFISEYYVRLHQKADYRGADPMLRLFVWRFMRALRARGLPFYVHTCFRSLQDQQRLKDAGFSQLGVGPHNRSAAVDIVSAIDHWEIPDALWHYVGTLGEEIARGTFLGQDVTGREPLKIEWGGRFKSLYDPAHWQLSDWSRRTMPDLEDEPLRLEPYSDQMRFG